MAFLFYHFYNWNNLKGLLLAVLFLMLSAITDLLDGKIARHFHQVSELERFWTLWRIKSPRRPLFSPC